jgi:dGTPase
MNSNDLLNKVLPTKNALSSLKTISGRRKNSIRFHDVDDPFIRDETALLASKALRRLACKTQVASYTGHAHIRNRLAHTMEVVHVAVRIASWLGLNVNLTRAIALGHDIGHVPLGHQGEQYLSSRLGKKFTHEVMGVVVAQHVERRGNGLNLSYEVLDGMYRHSGKNASSSMTPEAWVVRYADKISYLFADFNDFHRLHWPINNKLKGAMSWFGNTQRERTFTACVALQLESAEKNFVHFEESEAASRFTELRSLMYKEYVRVVEQDPGHVLGPLYDFLERCDIAPPHLVIALMTDDDVRRLCHHNTGMLNVRDIMTTGAGEIIRSFTEGKIGTINCFQTDLGW